MLQISSIILLQQKRIKYLKAFRVQRDIDLKAIFLLLFKKTKLCYIRHEEQEDNELAQPHVLTTSYSKSFQSHLAAQAE